MLQSIQKQSHDGCVRNACAYLFKTSGSHIVHYTWYYRRREQAPEQAQEQDEQTTPVPCIISPPAVSTFPPSGHLQARATAGQGCQASQKRIPCPCHLHHLPTLSPPPPPPPGSALSCLPELNLSVHVCAVSVVPAAVARSVRWTRISGNIWELTKAPHCKSRFICSTLDKTTHA